MRKILSTLLTGILVILGCSNKEAVTGISLDKSELSLVYGETATLTATVLPHNADNKTVSWSSSIPAIALVDNHGGVSATGAGSTVISAVTEDGGKSATCNLTVVEVENELRVMSFNIWGGGGKYVWMFNQHLNHCPYEPYMLNGIEYCGSGTLNTEEEAIASAWGARKNDVELTISEILKAQEEQIPIFLTDDFNEPSWLDWTERATTAGLCKIPVAQPATKKLQEQTGMKDSYRTVYPDEVAKPGYTWTPLPAAQEVLDRIDFVFFWGDVQVLKSEIAGEKEPESDIVIQSFPSDHRAVVSTFYVN